METIVPFCKLIGAPCIKPIVMSSDLSTYKQNPTSEQLARLQKNNPKGLVLVPGCGNCRVPDQQVTLAQLPLQRTSVAVNPQAAMFSKEPGEQAILGVRGGVFYALPGANSQDIDMINTLQHHGHDVKIMPRHII